jgi:hypothetical protein
MTGRRARTRRLPQHGTRGKETKTVERPEEKERLSSNPVFLPSSFLPYVPGASATKAGPFPHPFTATVSVEMGPAPNAAPRTPKALPLLYGLVSSRRRKRFLRSAADRHPIPIPLLQVDRSLLFSRHTTIALSRSDSSSTRRRKPPSSSSSSRMPPACSGARK